MNRTRMILAAASLPCGHPTRREILAGLHTPEIHLDGNRTSINRTFLDKLRQQFNAYVDSMGGDKWLFVHPKADTDPSGGSDYDIYLTPEGGFSYRVNATTKGLQELEKIAKTMRADFV
jgi:hypothetical protein